MPEAFRVSLTPRFYELDPYGHVNHSVYIQYFETARVDLLEATGFGLGKMLEQGLQIVVVRIAARFVSPAELGDQLTIETGLVKVRRVQARWAQRISSGERVVATQLVDFCGTDTNGRPTRLPADLIEAMHDFAVPEDWLRPHSP